MGIQYLDYYFALVMIFTHERQGHTCTNIPNGLLSAHKQNAIEMVFHLWADDSTRR